MTSEWDWIEETGLSLGGSISFARGASPERVMEAFGMQPANASIATAAQAEQSLPYPDYLETYPAHHPWIRVGTAGEWGFAIDESSGGYGGYEEDAARALSAGTEAVLVTKTASISYFHYYVDDAEVTAFEPLRGWERFGTDPDRFLPYMRQAGVPLDDEDAIKDPVIAVLEMVTLALGISLSRDVALGPLPTVQRD
jgi:Family of unknown function (DUF6461)